MRINFGHVCKRWAEGHILIRNEIENKFELLTFENITNESIVHSIANWDGEDIYNKKMWYVVKDSSILINTWFDIRNVPDHYFYSTFYYFMDSAISNKSMLDRSGCAETIYSQLSQDSRIGDNQLNRLFPYLAPRKKEKYSGEDVEDGYKEWDALDDDVITELDQIFERDIVRKQVNRSETNNYLDSVGTNTLPKTWKPNWKEYEYVCNQHRITKLFHFTDRSNIDSIKRYGGLFSWWYCETHGITIAHPGNNLLSKELDSRRGLKDYVRLGFNPNLPMMHVALNEGRIIDPVILEIDPRVIYWKDTLYSQINATDSNANIGDNINCFKQINFKVATAPNWYFDESLKKPFQAEVLVKTHIPLEFIRIPGEVRQTDNRSINETKSTPEIKQNIGIKLTSETKQNIGIKQSSEVRPTSEVLSTAEINSNSQKKTPIEIFSRKLMRLFTSKGKSDGK